MLLTKNLTFIFVLQVICTLTNVTTIKPVSIVLKRNSKVIILKLALCATTNMENPVIKSHEDMERWQDQENEKCEKLIASLSDEDEDKLETYHAENCADGVLDDDLYDNYQSWLETLNSEEILNIIK